MSAAVVTLPYDVATLLPRQGVTSPAEITSVAITPVGPAGPPGPPGTSGTGGSQAVVHEQTTAQGGWIITHSLGRVPAVSVYLSDGEQVDADVVATSTTVNITFADPTTGRAVLT